MVTVNKDAIIRSAAEKTGLPVASVKSASDALFDAIRARAEAGDTIRLNGFGAFSVKARPARTGRNPATGEPVDIPESRRLHFKAAKPA